MAKWQPYGMACGGESGISAAQPGAGDNRRKWLIISQRNRSAGVAAGKYRRLSAHSSAVLRRQPSINRRASYQYRHFVFSYVKHGDLVNAAAAAQLGVSVAAFWQLTWHCGIGSRAAGSNGSSSAVLWRRISYLTHLAARQ
jgi:hypothetical protein